MIPRVIPEAETEVMREALYYKRRGGPLLAAALTDEFEHSLSMLCTFPELGALWINGRRRFLLRRFPFGIIYYTRGEELVVVAFAHQRRRPGYWAERE